MVFWRTRKDGVPQADNMKGVPEEDTKNMLPFSLRAVRLLCHAAWCQPQMGPAPAAPWLLFHVFQKLLRPGHIGHVMLQSRSI